jgi:hypothetical protein
MIVLLVIGKMRERRNQDNGGLSGPGRGISAGDDGRADP